MRPRFTDSLTSSTGVKQDTRVGRLARGRPGVPTNTVGGRPARPLGFPRRGAYDSDMLQTVQWTGEACRLLDQTKLPTETCFVDVTDEKQMWDAIRRLVVRGAPAIGVAAA